MAENIDYTIAPLFMAGEQPIYPGSKKAYDLKLLQGWTAVYGNLPLQMWPRAIYHPTLGPKAVKDQAEMDHWLARGYQAAPIATPPDIIHGPLKNPDQTTAIDMQNARIDKLTDLLMAMVETRRAEVAANGAMYIQQQPEFMTEEEVRAVNAPLATPTFETDADVKAFVEAPRSHHAKKR